MKTRIETDLAGLITQAPDAPDWLRLSAKGATGRDLFLFFPSHRQMLKNQMAHVIAGRVGRPVQAILRPRDGRAYQVQITITLDEEATGIHWDVEREDRA